MITYETAIKANCKLFVSILIDKSVYEKKKYKENKLTTLIAVTNYQMVNQKYEYN